MGIIRLAIDDPKAEGPINAVSPRPVTNAQFSKAVGDALGRPSWLPVPDFALKKMLRKLLRGTKEIILAFPFSGCWESRDKTCSGRQCQYHQPMTKLQRRREEIRFVPAACLSGNGEERYQQGR